MKLQWFGKPGPREMLDRHSRPHAPLSANGRLFVMGDQRLYGLDAYNGTMLWERQIPEFQTRVNLPRDSGYMVTDENDLYLAVKNQCWQIDGDSGKTTQRYEMPDLPARDLFDWGYVADLDDTLLGSGIRKGNTFTDGHGPWYDGNEGFLNWENAKVCSDYLFGVYKETGRIKWRYEGIVLNSAIAAGDGKVYFVENRQPYITSKGLGYVEIFNRRLNVDQLWEDLHLVALDVQTGEKLWEKPAEFVKGTIVFYLSYADDTLVVVSGPHTSYWVYAFDAATGKAL